MNAALIAYTPRPERVCAAAAWTCTHAHSPTDDDLHPDKAGPLLRRVLSKGHDSILEHASFSFAISGISRACSHQLVRHRLASYSQQSQRYVSQHQIDWSVPDSWLQSTDYDRYRRWLNDAEDIYRDMIAEGIPEEDARYILPQACATRLVVTMNARQLRHFFALRCCQRAQWEIRALANEMLQQCKDIAPVLFELAGPPCKRGECPEGQWGCEERKGYR